MANAIDAGFDTASTRGGVHPVDEILPIGKLAVLGLQHVLVMYAGAVAVPLIIGGAVNLPKEQIALLINCDLVAAGIVTLIQSIGIWKFGIRMPVMMGVTFAAVSPMLAMGTNPELGLLGIFGATIAAGIFGIIVAPFVSRMLPLFPHVVTGVIISVIGLSLMRVAVNWAGGGVKNPNFGDPLYLGIAFIVLLSIILITRFLKGFSRQHLGAARSHHRLRHLARTRTGEFRRRRRGAMGGDRLSIPVRNAEVRSDLGGHHVRRDGGRHDRIHGHVPGAG